MNLDKLQKAKKLEVRIADYKNCIKVFSTEQIKNHSYIQVGYNSSMYGSNESPYGYIDDPEICHTIRHLLENKLKTLESELLLL